MKNLILRKTKKIKPLSIFIKLKLPKNFRKFKLLKIFIKLKLPKIFTKLKLPTSQVSKTATMKMKKLIKDLLKFRETNSSLHMLNQNLALVVLSSYMINLTLKMAEGIVKIISTILMSKEKNQGLKIVIIQMKTLTITQYK